MFKRKKEPFREGLEVGHSFANSLAIQFVQEGSPVPWPTTKAEVPAFVDQITPGAVQDIGTMMECQAGSYGAVPQDLVQGIEQGFRTRFIELVLKSLG